MKELLAEQEQALDAKHQAEVGNGSIVDSSNLNNVVNTATSVPASIINNDSNQRDYRHNKNNSSRRHDGNNNGKNKSNINNDNSNNSSSRRSNNNSRGHGRYHQHNVFNNRREVKVSGDTNPKAAAGAIAHQTRAGQPPLVLASGSHSINQAIKAIAIARGYLKDEGIDVSAFPEIRDSHGTAVCFDVCKRKRNYKKLQQATDDLKIASGSDPNIVAGAIAGKLRTMGNGLIGTRICLQAIGPNCVLQAVSSISVARRYLENDCIDLSFQPEFIEVSFGDGQIRNALRFSIMVQQV